MAGSQSQEIFNQLKAVCVPLLGSSLLSPTSSPNVSKLLSQLIKILRDVQESNFVLTTSLISYTFFPISTILRRNVASDIPDQILEKVFIMLGILCEDWWWHCDLAVWEQIFMLCGAIIGGIEGKGKDRDRPDETKEAAGQCLCTLLRQRSPQEEQLRSPTTVGASRMRLEEFKAYAQTDKFLPILGQTLNSLLITVESRTLSLQRLSLGLLTLIIDIYTPDDLIPSVLPGVISCISKVSLGSSKNSGWANGEVVAGALNVMQLIVIKAIGDDICIKDGAIHHIVNIEDLAQSVDEPLEESRNYKNRPFSTPRTPAWLHGTSSQLLIAMNSLTPLVAHPTPSALLSLSTFSTTVLGTTSLTIPSAQPLLLSFLLSLSLSEYSSVAEEAHKSLLALLTIPSRAQPSLLQTLLHSTSENLSALPRLLLTHDDTKVEHIAGLIEATCRLATTDGKHGLSSISIGVEKLLGPAGGIEKWGWNLLSVLELVEPPITIFQTSSAQLMLESNPQTPRDILFPEVAFKNVFSNSTRVALERMFHCLGRAGGDSCLFSAEWFTNVGRKGSGSKSVAATWCACRLLEGIAGVSLSKGSSGDSIYHRKSKRLIKQARSLARSIAELWDEAIDTERTDVHDDRSGDDEPNFIVQHVHGLSSIHENLRIVPTSHPKESTSNLQPILHKALLLQLLAVSAGILETQFTSMLIYTLYPVLHSLVSPSAYLSSTALATLNFITVVTSYASPANLLLSNFDYALDAISRRLSRRWLDVDATKVLALMVRLVGSDIVEKAGDIIEECFDRLDEFHGYGVIVEGLIEVLGEVINAIKIEVEAEQGGQPIPRATPDQSFSHSMEEFLHWLPHRNDPLSIEDTTDYGPAPREAWGEGKGKGIEAEENNEAASLQEPDADAGPPPTAIQSLTKQIVSRSLYFLTHGSPVIRARILILLGSSVSVLPASALLPSIHSAWPLILNRLADSELFIISAAATLIEALVVHHGSFMFRRIWDDVWPRFLALLEKLASGDTASALLRRGYSAVGTDSAYTYSHRLYRSLIKTMTAAMKGVDPHDTSVWQVLLAFKRFLHSGAHEELQSCARDLYVAIGQNNTDAVWLALSAPGDTYTVIRFLKTPQWDIEANVISIFQNLGVNM